MKVPICPLCQNRKVKMYLKSEFSIYKCFNCQLYFLHPKLELDKLNLIYQKKYFTNSSKTCGYTNYSNLTDSLQDEAKRKILIVKKYCTLGNLLDIGAGTGIFLEIAKENGFKIYANDISKFAEKELIKKKITSYIGPLEWVEFPRNYFNMITAWDVIEHLSSPAQALYKLGKSLKRGGYLFITTPNTESIDAKIMKKYWYGFKKIPEHLVFFNPESIKYLLNLQGFEVQKITPWGFIRPVGFVTSKLEIYSSFFTHLSRFCRITNLYKLKFFFPLTDMLIIARKK